VRWLAVLVVVASAGVAMAEPELGKEFQAGVDAFRLGKLDDARAHLEKARALAPKLPGPHRFLAAVAQAQGRWQDCIDGARKALELNPLSVEAPETRKLHDGCRASAGLAPYRDALGDSAAIAVTTNVPGATVKIGGLTYGGTPLSPRPITAGALELDIAKAGWKPAHVSIVALPGIVTDVAVELEADPTASVEVDLGVKKADRRTTGWLELPQPAMIDGVSRDRGRIELAPGTHTIELREPEADRWRRRVRVIAGQKIAIVPAFVDTSSRVETERLGLGVLAGGGALLAGGFIAALVSQHAAADAREIQRVEQARDPANPGYALEPLHTRADFDAARSRARTFAIVSDVTIGAAVVTAGLGAYFLWKGERERTDVPPPFYVAPTPSGAMVGKQVAW
jgi:hypothetical protein